MFDIGDYVVFGTDGVCTVEAVGSLDMEGVSKEKLYYTLAPVGKSGNNRIFAPVDGKRVVMRRVITPDEAKALIGKITEIEPLDVPDERKREEAYKAALMSCDVVQMVRLIKEIYRRRQARFAAGKKLPAIDERYCNLAENSLYSELSLPLNVEKSRVEEYITDAVEHK
ncbi:MAG: CarD family transcriptional regulator [Lachnospiraceae bacterium]|nr:CarD family transcriptional regulator [Lachnospiraceae bacterium]MBP5652871.1 CarD family transcriptional regulator [Lachnospiraceae bacterium]